MSHERRVIVLGSTGSIGVSTLRVIERLNESGGYRFRVVGLAAASNVDRLAEQARRFAVPQVAIAAASKVSQNSFHGDTRVHAGPGAAADLVRHADADLVVAAIVGFAGLAPTVAAIERGRHVALANKETLVAAGSIIMPLARERGVRIIPIDSEHSAIYQCLRAGPDGDHGVRRVRRITLTASGGPFRDWSADQIAKATIKEALAHPTWNMGAKVTIDSATMMNKGLEVIEASYLFGLPSEQIEVLVHPQSIVHGLVEFDDGSVLAQLSPPDMCAPIQYALTAPDRPEGCAERLDWGTLRRLDFEPPDEARFPCLRLARLALERGGGAGVVLNAANEIAVAAFLEHRLRFGQIPEIVEATMNALQKCDATTIEAVTALDASAREDAHRRIG
ncbi:MAG: 1-deoxy-D-xylulose-5-phosphate reductoisomerase [Phycisphaerales bacterium]